MQKCISSFIYRKEDNMKVCLHFNKKSKYLDKADEIIIKAFKTNILRLKGFFEHYPNATAVLDVTDEKNIPYFIAQGIDYIIDNYKDYTDRIKFLINLSHESIEILLPKIKENNFKFFFINQVATWDDLNYFTELGASDIYIVGDLAFSLGRIRKISRFKNISLRIFPNICQTSCKTTFPAIKGFFIRPEELDDYKNLIDIVEFFNQERENVYYRIYFIKKHWAGLLNHLIINFISDKAIDNRRIAHGFGKARLICEGICKKDGRCEVCDTILKIEKNLDERDMMINYQVKNKNEEIPFTPPQDAFDDIYLKEIKTTEEDLKI